MLEVKNLTKIYKSKGGDVKALDDVSVSFGKTGLVFLLGKSGSGKSTLLNLIGGLDEPTSGEVVVLGKSSKDFSSSDFDSYRNTYVGFIFQEYNILNEFNVEDNIALALELQGKRKDKDKIARILSEVGLREYARRSPNTLSGGQKQRIAIARALVKDPQIIMADEPTGALDSTTGKQVFETLKKLSLSRLVLVVSHDRDFATQYGDRIIELSDGKIISDISKTKEEAEVISPYVIKHGDKTLTIRQGTTLDGQIIEQIQGLILNSDSDIIISGGKDEVAGFKKLNRIDDEGAREHFVASKPPRESADDRVDFIRSKLPAAKAIKIGVSSLRLKPFRLIVTILLSLFAFVMFGLFSTVMLYNGKTVMNESFLSSDYKYLTLQKKYEVRVPDRNYTMNSGTKFTPDEVGIFGENSFGAYSAYSTPSNLSIEKNLEGFYRPLINKIAVLPANHPLRSRFTGSYPTAVNEIAVSSYFLECAVNSSFRSLSADGVLGDEITISGADDLIGQYIGIMGAPTKITGIFDSGDIPPYYEPLKDPNYEDEYIASMMYYFYLDDGLHALAFASDAFIENFARNLGSSSFVQYFDYTTDYYSLTVESGPDDYKRLFNANAIKVYDEPKLEVTLFKEIAKLDDTQVIVPFSAISNYFEAKLENLAIGSDDWNDEQRKSYEEAVKDYNEQFGQYIKFFMSGTIKDPVTKTQRKPTTAEKDLAKQKILTYLKNCEPLTVSLRLNNMVEGVCEIVGAYIPDWENGEQKGLYCSQGLYNKANFSKRKNNRETKYVLEKDAVYDYVLTPFAKNEDDFNALTAMLEVVDPDTDVLYSMYNVLYYQVTSANKIVNNLSRIFLLGGILLALFAALMLFNFISVSISAKNKEIGILRAVGARGIDVFKIFFAESSVIVGTCMALSFIGAIAATRILNIILKAKVGLDVTLFVFGPLSVVLMLAVAVTVAFAATFFPVYFAAKKKPVDSIRSL